MTLVAPPGAHGAHVQIVRALPMSERQKLAERFEERNGPGWEITLGEGEVPDDVDAIRGLVRRGTNVSAGPAARAGSAAAPSSPAAPRSPGGEPRATAAAIAFATKNADLFGMSPRDVAALDVDTGPAKTAIYGAWVVHLQGRIPMRGYEGFDAVAATIDVLIYAGDDGDPRYFVNLSRVHPPLVLDTTAMLGPDDARVLRNVVGRELFVLESDPRRPNARMRELRRRSLGRVEDGDVRGIRLVIHVSPGLRGAWVSYWLAYSIDVLRGRHVFRFVVDADTGEILEDTRVPVLPAGPREDD